MFTQDWAERDEDTGLIIERILILIRNVLHVPADLDKERRPENDTSVHDQVSSLCFYSQNHEMYSYITLVYELCQLIIVPLLIATITFYNFTELLICKVIYIFELTFTISEVVKSLHFIFVFLY